MSTTCQSLSTIECCKMKFTIHICVENNFFNVKSGCGIPFPNNHPKTRNDEVQYPQNHVTTFSLNLQSQLLVANAPTQVMRQVLNAEAGVSFARSFYKNTSQSQNDIGMTSADKLLNYLSSQGDIK